MDVAQQSPVSSSSSTGDIRASASAQRPSCSFEKRSHTQEHWFFFRPFHDGFVIYPTLRTNVTMEYVFLGHNDAFKKVGSSVFAWVHVIPCMADHKESYASFELIQLVIDAWTWFDIDWQLRRHFRSALMPPWRQAITTLSRLEREYCFFYPHFFCHMLS